MDRGLTSFCSCDIPGELLQGKEKMSLGKKLLFHGKKKYPPSWVGILWLSLAYRRNRTESPVQAHL
jgi:hypothetical protein